jgi:hypothetical protein
LNPERFSISVGQEQKKNFFLSSKKNERKPKTKNFFPSKNKLNPERFSISVGQEQKKNFFLSSKRKMKEKN